MQEIIDNIPILVVTVMLGVLIVVGSFVLLLLRNQNKLSSEKNKRQESEIEYQKQLLRSVIESQETERTRIGRDLHDDVGSALYNLRIILDRVEKENITDQSPNELISVSKSHIDNIINDVRNICHNLSPELLTIQTLTEAVEHLCYTIDSSSDLSVFFTNEAGSIPDNLDLTTSLAIYRVLEELATNTIKHAKANTIHIYIGLKNDQLFIDYRDDGQGMPASAELKKGRGLNNIESRLRIIQATHTLQSVNGNGYNLQIQIPILSN